MLRGGREQREEESCEYNNSIRRCVRSSLRSPLGVHPVIPGSLEYAVVRLPATVKYPVRVALPRKQDPVEVPLGPAGCNVTPVFPLFDLPQLGEEVDHGHLELAGVDAVVGGYEGVAEVVDGVLHEGVQLCDVRRGVKQREGRLAYRI